MQIRDLTPYALNSQLGIKGSVVNIPVSVPEMIDVLPRSMNNLMIILIAFKRRLEHKSNYMCATVRPKYIYDGLIYLIRQELYRLYNITVNNEIMDQFAESEEQMDFIIDPNDKNLLEDSKKKSITIPSDGESDLSEDESPNEVGLKLRSKRQIDSFFSLNDDDDDVLLLDLNEEIAKNTILSIAPGENKKPVPWLVYPHIHELSFPKINGGHKFNNNKVSYTNRVKSELRRADRRSCGPDHVLYMAKEKQERQCLASLNVCLRKSIGDPNMTAGNLSSEGAIDKIVSHQIFGRHRLIGKCVKKKY